jgi:hypothetical protein
MAIEIKNPLLQNEMLKGKTLHEQREVRVLLLLHATHFDYFVRGTHFDFFFLLALDQVPCPLPPILQ